ncbi:MAG: DUF4491 family protein [Muribaculaceae bacterium]|nr:DUF4491 family protein [Muribaculaceae bacterium]
MDFITDFFSNYGLNGLFIGLCTFLIIGLFHPLVIKGEYYFGEKIKWAFLAGGILFLIGSVMVNSLLLSAILGVASFSSFWGIKEVTEQVERVRKGWFPANPKRSNKKIGSKIEPTNQESGM